SRPRFLGIMLVQLNPNEAATTFEGSNAGCPASRKWIQHQVAGIACTADDRANESERQLCRQIRNSLLAVLDEARNGPHVIPKLSVGVGPFILVLVEACGRARDGFPVEHEPARVLHAVKNVP